MEPVDCDRLIQGLYRAASGQAEWPDALQVVSDALGGSMCQIVAVEKSTGRLALSVQSRSAPVEGVLDYIREFHRHDPHAAHALSLPAGEPFQTSTLISSQQARTHSFYRDFWSVYDTRFMLAAKVVDDGELVDLFGAQRSEAQGPGTTDQVALFKRVLDHLAVAFSIFRRVSWLTSRAEVGSFVLDRMSRPAILVDAQRAIVHANSSARAKLERGDVIVSRGGFLCCRDPHVEAVLTRELIRLELLASPSAGTRERVVFALRNLAGAAVPAVIWALRPGTTMAAFGDAPRALVMLPTEGAEHEPDPAVLEASFDLTPAEGRVLALLAHTLDIKAVAAALRISVHTARAHLRSVFDKTGVHSQKALLQQVQQLLAF